MDVGAINWATFIGGLEIPLGCDFLVASQRPVFADTHARVGFWGWRYDRPTAACRRLGRGARMSLTGEGRRRSTGSAHQPGQ